jgi:Family of unknown function (DUF6247)
MTEKTRSGKSRAPQESVASFPACRAPQVSSRRESHPPTVSQNPGLSKRPIGSTVGAVVDAIRAVLAELAPHDLVEFEAEFRCALAQADDDFDLAPVQAVVNRWWGRASAEIHPPTAEEGGSAWT